jgi:hypothetical protein
MLAGLLGQEQGRVTSTRVLPGNGAGPEMEISFRATGVVLGVHTIDLGTYVTSVRPDGSLFGEGQGVVTTPDGEIATWRGQGVGRRNGGGTAWRGAIYYQTACERLVALNGMAVVFEFDVDEQGETEARIWEWR